MEEMGKATTDIEDSSRGAMKSMKVIRIVVMAVNVYAESHRRARLFVWLICLDVRLSPSFELLNSLHAFAVDWGSPETHQQRALLQQLLLLQH